MKNNTNPEVSKLIDALAHPFRKEIESLRLIILDAIDGLEENIKWNGPNYTYQGQDRITMKINPSKIIQIIFHRGAKKQDQPPSHIINDVSGLLTWKENDRALAGFKDMADIESKKQALTQVVCDWVKATV